MMRHAPTLRTLALALPLAALLVSGPAAAQSDDAKARAAKLLDEGVAEFNAGRFAAALGRFQAAYDVFPSPKIQLNLGEALRKLGRDAEAAEAYDRFLVETEGAAEVSADKRRRAQKALEVLLHTVVRVTLSTQPAAATVSVDGQTVKLRPGRPLFLPPGSYQIGATAPGHLAATVPITVAAGAEQAVTLTLAAAPGTTPAPAPPPPPVRPRRLLWTWVAGAAALGLAAGGTVMAVRADSAWHDYKKNTDPARYDSLRSDVSTNALVANALFISAGVAALGTVAIYYLLERPRGTEARLTLTPAGAGLLGLGLVARY